GGRTVRRAAPAARDAAPPAARPAREPASEIDLAEIEALAGLGRRRTPRAAGGEPPAAAAEGRATAPAREESPPVAAALADSAAAELLAAAPAPPLAAAPPAPPPLAAEPPSAPFESGPPDLAGEPPPLASDPGAPAAIDAAPVDAAEPQPAEPPVPPETAEAALEAPAADATPSEPIPTAASFPAQPTGRRFGHYTLLDRIAVGGMAEVWKARMSGVEGFQKTVAIKRILPHMNDDADFVDMFIDEAKLAAQLNHPNITHIYDLGKIGDDYYIAMEFVDGRNLRAILNESRRKALPLPVGFALVVASRLASGLDYAHRKRDFDGRDLELVHRDVSPQNVLISTDGDIKLCDFGISKAVAKVSQTETGALKGKLQYMSPEQAWGRPVDPRSDIFSLGALTFEMLTGERLFTGDSEISVLEAVRECRVRGPRQVNPEVPESVDAVVRKALEREPADRYPTAGSLQQALEEVLYRLRPTPGQSDVAAFLSRLAESPDARPGSRREGTAAAAGSAAGVGGSASGTPGGAGPSPAADGTGAGARAAGAGGGEGAGGIATGTGAAARAAGAEAVRRSAVGSGTDAGTGTGTGAGTGSRATGERPAIAATGEEEAAGGLGAPPAAAGSGGPGAGWAAAGGGFAASGAVPPGGGADEGAAGSGSWPAPALDDEPPSGGLPAFGLEAPEPAGGETAGERAGDPSAEERSTSPAAAGRIGAVDRPRPAEDEAAATDAGATGPESEAPPATTPTAAAGGTHRWWWPFGGDRRTEPTTDGEQDRREESPSAKEAAGAPGVGEDGEATGTGTAARRGHGFGAAGAAGATAGFGASGPRAAGSAAPLGSPGPFRPSA
ncbi:MAG TPA: serine/threonine-protein kinase, partial [Thermoanaerobaculia bacterium]